MNGVMQRIWAVMVARCEKLDMMFWEWQSADGAMCKSLFAGKTNRNPTDRGKPGTKRSILVAEQGGPPEQPAPCLPISVALKTLLLR